jgi:hypothetical protein
VRSRPRSSQAAVVAVKSAHTIVCVVMSSAVLYVVASGLSGTRGPLFWPAVGLILIEGICYAAGRRRCPLTTLARSLGDSTGHDYLSEWLVPSRWVRYIVPSCGALFTFGLLLATVTALLASGQGR